MAVTPSPPHSSCAAAGGVHPPDLGHPSRLPGGGPHMPGEMGPPPPLSHFSGFLQHAWVPVVRSNASPSVEAGSALDLF